VQGVKDPLDRIRELEDYCEALENARAQPLSKKIFETEPNPACNLPETLMN
jgi:hypothetical protein